MSRKLGYTWYPKDWQYSDRVFQLDPYQRGIYRELIDLSYMTDNKIPLTLDTYARRWNATVDDIKKCLKVLIDTLKLVEIRGETLFVHESEPRLKMIRGGREGGSAKPSSKGSVKGTIKPTLKGSVNQREREIESKKESKKKKTTPPSLQQVKDYFKERGYTESSALRAFDYYQANDWHDQEGKKVRSWKQKMIAVWMKDENKIKEKRAGPIDYKNADVIGNDERGQQVRAMYGDLKT